MADTEIKKQDSLLKKIENSYMLFCSSLIGLSVILLASVILLRVAFHISYDYFIDICVWLVIWSGFLLTGPAYGMKAHISIDAILQKLKGKVRLAVDLLNALCTLFWVVIITWGGIVMVQNLYSQGVVYPRYISIPIWIIQICVPIAFFVFAIYVVLDIYKIARNFKSHPSPEKPKEA